MNSILVSGGAGYIGSHTVRTLAEQGYKPVVLDSPVTGHRQSVSLDIPFYIYNSLITASREAQISSCFQP